MRARNRGQRGTTTTLALGCALALAVLGIGGAALGRLVAARVDTQRAADAAALAAADLIREQGLAADHQGAFVLGQLNVRNLDVAFTRGVAEDDVSVRVQVTSATEVPAPRLVFNDPTLPVTAQATAIIGQRVFRDATWRIPFLTMVLDYSGSMSSMLGNHRSLDVLEDSVRRLAQMNLRIKFSVVFFSDNAFVDIPFDLDGPDEVLDELRTSLDQYDTMGGTCTDCGLAAAYEHFADGPDDDPGRYVLLVSDGAPNNEGAARNQAERLWNDFDVTIITLHIDPSGRDSGTGRFMLDVSGDRDSHPDEDLYFPVSNDTSLEETFQQIVSQLLCMVGPLDPNALEDPATIRVFLRNRAGVERRVRPENNLAEHSRELAFRYVPADSTLRMTYAACEAIIENGEDVVVRYNRARLVE